MVLGQEEQGSAVSSAMNDPRPDGLIQKDDSILESVQRENQFLFKLRMRLRDERVWMTYFRVERNNPPVKSMSLTVVNEANFDEEVKLSKVPVLVDFWAEWCGPCRMLTPVLEQLAEEKGAAVKITKVNVDENPGLAQEFSVRSIPMLAFFHEGELKDTIVGIQPKEAIAAILDDLSL